MFREIRKDDLQKCKGCHRFMKYKSSDRLCADCKK